MMERTSMAEDNSERQHSVGGINKGSSSEIVREKERGGDLPETEVMVGRVSSTTEHGLLPVHKKQLEVAKRVLPDKIPEAKAMAEKQRNKEKYLHSKTLDQDVSRSKLNKPSQSPLGREDERLKRQLQGMSSASRKDKGLYPHISTKKCNTREDKQVESEVSSSLTSALLKTSLSATTQNRPLSSTLTDRKFNSSNQKPDTKSHNERDKYVRAPSGNVNTFIAHGSPLGASYKQGKRENFRQSKEMHTKQGSHSQHDRAFHRDKNRESSSYEKMVEMKVREIRNNLQKMSTEAPKVLTGLGSKEAFSESRRKANERHSKEKEEEDSPLVPFLPSSRCCSPPSRPTNVTKYWSDAEETEDESDMEVHLMHINSVNIVLNFLKKNTNQYYVDGSKIKTQNKNGKTMQAKRNSDVKNMLSYQPHTVSCFAGSKTVHPRDHSQLGKRRGMSMSPAERYHGGTTMRKHRSPVREHYGHSSRSRSPVLLGQASWRDQRSKSPSSNAQFYDERSPLISSGYRRHSHSRSRSPPAYQESSRNRDYRYRHSSSQRNERNFVRDRRSDSPLTHGVGSCNESFSPCSYKEGFHRNRESRSPSPVFDEESAYRNRGFSPKSSERSSHPRSPQRHVNFNQRKQMLYGTDTSCHSEDLHFLSLNSVDEPKVDHEKHGAFRSPELHLCYADSSGQPARHGLSHKGRALSQGREMHLKGKDSFSTNRTGCGFSPSSQYLSPSHSDHQEPSYVRHAHGFGSPRPGCSEGSAEPHASVVRQESDFGRPRSRSSEKKVTSRWQLIKQENENKLPLEFGRGAKKALTSVEPSGWERNYLSIDNRKQQKRSINFPESSDPFFSGIGEDTDEYQKRNRSENEKGQGQREEKDTNSLIHLAQASPSLLDVITLDDDEPTIDRPEDYLNTSSSLSTYHQPSFVPDVHERQKLVGSPETIELSPTQEDLGVPGPSGTTSVHSLGETERDDSPYRHSHSTCDKEAENVDSTVSQIRSAGKPNVAELSSTQKGVSTEVARTEEEKAVLTLNSAEMSTLLTLINLAKQHVATGKSLPTNLSQIMESVQDTNKSKISEPQGNQSRNNENDTNKSNTSEPQGSQSRKKENDTNKSKISEPQENQSRKKEYDTNKSKISEPHGNQSRKKENDTNKSKISEPQENQSRKNENNTNNSKISEPQGNQIRKNQKKQISAGMQDKAEKEKKIKATTFKSNIKDNGNSGNGENSKRDVALATNKKNSAIPEGKKDEIVLKSKTDDNLSRTKDKNKPLQSKSKTQENKTDDKLPQGKKSHEQPKQKNMEETSQEKCKEKGQSSGVGTVSETIKKKKVDHKVDAKRQSNNNTKGTVIERTFAEMQSVRVELSASREVVASSKKGECYKVKGTTTLRSSKKKRLKQVGKRILIKDSSDSDNDSDDSESLEDKNDGTEANKSQTVHPLHQETIVLDHSVNTCLACKHILKPDEFTSMSLSTGTVTMRCRNCHTYTKMEKVMPLDFNTAISMPKNVASKATCSASSKTSETSGTSVDNSNKVSKKGNLMASSKGQNENTNKKGQHLDTKKESSKEKKHSSQESKNAVQEGKARTEACKKGIDKKLRLADVENASKTASAFKSSKDDKCQRDRAESESSSTSNKSTDCEMRKEEQKSRSDFDSIDPSLRVFPWSSSRKRKKLHENLVLDDDSSDSDKSSRKQQPHKRRKKNVSYTKQLCDDDTSAHSSTSTKIVKPNTTTKASITAKSSDAAKTSNSTKSVVNTDLGLKEKKSSMNTKSTTSPKPTTASSSITTSKSTTASKPATATKSVTPLKQSTTFKPKTDPKSSTTSKSPTTPKPSSDPKK